MWEAVAYLVFAWLSIELQVLTEYSFATKLVNKYTKTIIFTLLLARQTIGGMVMKIERRMNQRRCYKAYTKFPISDYRGNIIISERRRLLTRRSYEISVEENQFFYQLD